MNLRVDRRTINLFRKLSDWVRKKFKVKDNGSPRVKVINLKVRNMGFGGRG